MFVKKMFKFFLILLTLKSTAPTVISNLNLIFEMFNPISMVRFFEFNDKGWNITEGCIQDMFVYLDALHKDHYWAVKLYDASGYYSGGIYAGNEIRMGNQELCQRLDKEFEKLYFDSMITFAVNQSFVPFGVHMVNAKYRAYIDHSQYSSKYKIVQSACVPKSCQFEDLKQIMSYTHLPNMRNTVFVNSAELTSLRIVHGKYKFYEDFSFFVFIVITTLILLLNIFAAIFEKCTNFEVNINLPSGAKIVDAKNVSYTTSSSSNNSIIAQSAIEQLTKLNNNERNSCTKLKMDPLAESMTVNNINTNKHVNLVQVKKIKMENSATISLDIIAGNCDYVNCNRVAHYRSAKGIFRKLLLAFSWRQNFKHFINCNHKYCKEVPIVCGIKVLCLMWIILIHTCTVLYYVADNKLYKRKKLNDFGVMAELLDHGTFSIDTFFFLSGVTISHTFYSTLKRIDLEQISEAFDRLLHFTIMILYKILRLLFPYLIVLILLKIIMKHFNDHSTVDLPSMDHLTCQDNMWRNMLYVDTFFPIQTRCMIWSWYISLESQFFIAACIILLLAQNYPRYASVICTAFFISSFLTTTIVRYNKRQNTDLNFDEELANFNSMYDQPWARISPYLLGMCLGYTLYKTKEKIDINIFVIVFGWIACFLLLGGVVFSHYYFAKINPWTEAAISATTHTVWSMILFWITLASISQHKGWIGRFLSAKCFQPLSKLSNCVLLIHPLITRLIILSSDQTFHLSFSLIVTMYFGFTILIFISSFLLYMTYEAPISSLLKIFYYKNLQKL